MTPPDSKTAPRTLTSAVGVPLEGRFFHSPDIYHREQDQLFRGQWLCAGHMSELEREGDFFTRSMGRDPLLFARSELSLIHI